MKVVDRSQLEVYLTEEEIKKRIDELGKEIERDYGRETDLCIVGVLKGSFVFLADLVRAINSDRVMVDFLGVSSYGDSTKSSGVVKVTQDLTTSIEGKDVIIVEDIIDTGLTMKYLIDNFKTRHPKSLKVCTLLHKKDREIEKVDIDYVGFVIPDRFVVGYGLDGAQRYRNLKFIGIYPTQE